MNTAVEHINLLQRSGPERTVAWRLAAVLAATGLGLVYYGSELQAAADHATGRRGVVAAQLKQIKAQMSADQGEQAKSASTLALREEIDALKPQAQTAQALLDAVRAADGGQADEFARALAAITTLAEPGLWLTSLTVSEAGKRLDLSGEARNGASVLRYARRANEALRPLALRLGSLEMKPVSGSTAVPAAAGAVAFHLF